MRCCIVHIVEGEAEIFFQRITAELSEKFGISNLSNRVPAHITLKYPFEADDAGILKIEHSIQKVANARKPAPFVIDGFGKFDEKTIFLSVEANAAFDSFIKECIRDLGKFNEDRKFDADTRRVHVSIARHLEAETFSSIWTYLLNLPRPHFIASFNNISLLVEENDIWKNKKTFRIV